MHKSFAGKKDFGDTGNILTVSDSDTSVVISIEAERNYDQRMEVELTPEDADNLANTITVLSNALKLLRTISK